MMKIAEIIPLYKGKERDEVVNYRPISLLMTISKLLEKIIYICCALPKISWIIIVYDRYIMHIFIVIFHMGY